MTELESLKERADLMGLSYHPSIGVDKLRDKVNAKINGEETTEESVEVPLSKRQQEQAEILEAKKVAGQLVRINAVCLNPVKKDWGGEIFTTGNSKIGTFRKFVQFNTDEGYHVPRIIFELLKEKKFQTFVTRKTANGVKVREGKLVPEFNVVELPALTSEELADLAKAQAARG